MKLGPFFGAFYDIIVIKDRRKGLSMERFLGFIKTRINLLVELKSLKEGVNRISDRQLSISIGKSPSYINDVMADRTIPSLKTLSKIREYFGISIEEFLNPGYDPCEKMLKDMIGEREVRDFLEVAKENSDSVRRLLIAATELAQK